MKLRSLWQSHKFFLGVFSILVAASLLRFPFLTLFTPAMLQDEANIGFNAMSIAETGRDEWGHPYPLTFKSFGDDKPPVYFYTTALVYKLLGWSPALPRIPSAVAGVVSTLLVILLVKKLTDSQSAALLTGAVMALSPWTIQLSRMALESNLALSFFLFGLLLF